MKSPNLRDIGKHSTCGDSLTWNIKYSRKDSTTYSSAILMGNRVETSKRWMGTESFNDSIYFYTVQFHFPMAFPLILSFLDCMCGSEWVSHVEMVFEVAGDLIEVACIRMSTLAVTLVSSSFNKVPVTSNANSAWPFHLQFSPNGGTIPLVLP